MPATRDIEIYQGDNYAHQLTLKDSANAVINITSRTYSGQIRKRRNVSITVTPSLPLSHHQKDTFRIYVLQDELQQ